ncbi:AI-2E family transporter [Desulfonatronovibrio hydrogenovorans]|uniref:AI-2E family transporter n=1 Tax=Desulfonatronovibrio hydrogenovorans TaxID=53245 RepID=UPI00048B97E0|nr:AI-2E family transporter [Desulfonatronovibrio hydrogenovorans]
MQLIKTWFQRQFGNPQVVILMVLLLTGFGVIYFLGKMLVPFFAGLIIAYLLDGVVKHLTKRGVPRLLAVILVFLFFMLILLFSIFWLVPQLTKQVTQLVQQLPNMISETQNLLLQLPEHYPKFISEEQVYEIFSVIRGEVGKLAQNILSISVASVMGLITLLVYLIIVPLLVFFFLMDKEKIIGWFSGFLPRDRSLAVQVWEDVNIQIANYIRGKTWEIIIVWIVTFLVFTLLKLQYAMLLGAIVGFSVLIPYVGAAVATIPVAMVAYFQWGIGSELVWVLIVYAIIQMIDGNVLAPLLLAEVVDIHPVAVIASILVFGGLWGFVGIFFAIPLATLIQAIIKAWPAYEDIVPPEPVPAADPENS